MLNEQLALVYETSNKVNKSLAFGLKQIGWDAQVLNRDLGALMTVPADLWVVDLGLGIHDVGSLLEALSHLQVTVPLLIVTEQEQLAPFQPEITALHDSWPTPLHLLVKPYSQDELAIRVSWLTRGLTRVPAKGPVYEIGALRVDTGKHKVWFSDKLVTLSRSELLLLIALVRAGGQVISKSTLGLILHGSSADYDHNAIKTHVSRLRVRLRAAGADPRSICAVHGTGYALDVALL